MSTAKGNSSAKIMSRVRFGHTGLNSTLFRMAKHESGECSCGELETVEHFLFRNERCQVETRALII